MNVGTILTRYWGILVWLIGISASAFTFYITANARIDSLTHQQELIQARIDKNEIIQKTTDEKQQIQLDTQNITVVEIKAQLKNIDTNVTEIKSYLRNSTTLTK